jgi:hypothetical protein
MCSICQFPVEDDDVRTRCPHCGLPFHAECWDENYGCSAYGCPQVNALKPSGPVAAAQAPRPQGGSAALAPEPFPWDFLFLGASAVSALVGLVAFGVPCLVVLLVTLSASLFTKRRRRKALFLLCVLICVAGAVGGSVTSQYLWISLVNK